MAKSLSRLQNPMPAASVRFRPGGWLRTDAMRLLPAHVDRDHPINTGRYAIFTPAVDAFAAKLGDWIDSKITGAYIYGPSRFGKTRAIRWHGSAAPFHCTSGLGHSLRRALANSI
jgi:hypothetical protein